MSGIRTATSKAVNDFEDISHKLKQEIKVLINGVKDKNYELNNTIINLLCRSMKINLIFTCLKEPENEITVHLIRGLLETNNTSITSLNVHRFGTGTYRLQPYFLRFIYHNDLSMVITNTYRLKKKHTV